MRNFIFNMTSLAKRNYVLVGSDSDTQTVELILSDGNSNSKTFTYNNVPFRANWRTNIFGYLLTNDVNITVKLAPNFADQTGDDEDESGNGHDEWYNGNGGVFSN